MTASASASMEGFCMDRSDVHATWQVINGNVMAEQIYHVTNASGNWLNSPVRADSHTSRGALTIDAARCGHALVSVETPTDTELYCVNSAPLVGLTAAAGAGAGRLRLPSVTRTAFRVTVPAGSATAAAVYAADGRLARSIPATGDLIIWDLTDNQGRRVHDGAYVFRCGTRSGRTLILK
jgi:hypothetical protein